MVNSRLRTEQKECRKWRFCTGHRNKKEDLNRICLHRLELETDMIQTTTAELSHLLLWHQPRPICPVLVTTGVYDFVLDFLNRYGTE